jgi:hypothetical protein
MTSGLAGLVAGMVTRTAGAATAAAPAASPAAGPPGPREAQQVIAAHQINNCLNRYTAMESFGRVTDMQNEFANTVSDVQVDVGFGWYYGAEGIRRFCEVNGLMVGNFNRGTLLNGTALLFGNTSEIIEVAEDLKTAKGLWLTWLAVTTGDTEAGFKPRWGCARRAVDFIQVGGVWKIWHYFVYGLINAPPGRSWTDPDVVQSNQADIYDWIPDTLKPNLPSAYGIGNAGGWRPDRPMVQVRVPVPYRTFAETFSYARTL